MDYRIPLKVDSSEVIAAAAALRDQKKAAEELLAVLRDVAGARSAAPAGGSHAPAFSAARDEDFKRSKWEQGAPKPSDAKPAGGGKGAKIEPPKTGAFNDARKAIVGTTDAATGLAKSVVSVALGVAAYGAALAGLHSIGDLTNMAIGWRNLGRLQLISWKATMDLRQAVRGVDASPLVRVAQRLEGNLSKSTVTGRALSGILTRGFGGVFDTVEKLGPAIEWVFQSAVLYALKAESAWLGLRIAALPLTSTFDDVSDAVRDLGGALSDLEWPTEGTTTADVMDLVGYAAKAAAVSVRELAAALKWYNEGIRAVPSTAVEKHVGAFAPVATAAARAVRGHIAGPGHATSDEDIEALGARMKAEGDKGAADARRTGNDIGRGIADGIDDQADAVKAAGGRAADAANEGARTRAQAHSPSELMRQGIGHDMPDGMIAGFDDRRGAVASAAADLVPEVKAGKGSGAAGGAPSGGITVAAGAIHLDVHIHGKTDREEARAGVMQGAQDLLRALCLLAGLPVPST